MTNSDPSRAPKPDPKEPDDLSRDRVKGRVMQSMFGQEPEPVKVGRFMMIDRLGAGGMGVVYSCYDPQLKREVAVKLLQAGRGEDSEGSQGRERLLREAQAMASLSHPNVLPVFETGEHKGRVFMAMELVKGETLRAWQQAEQRSWREVVEKYLQAAGGLAAAHDASIVHRDFKPENALVGADGRVRVMDFGLARDAQHSEVSDSIQARARLLGPTALTETGTLLGTPAYMSPEQHKGQTADARSDQFAWCVALWEALYGERPFGGETYGALRKEVLAGSVRAPPRRGVPDPIRKALLRGLCLDPAARHDDIRTLAALVSRRRHRTREVLPWLTATALVGGLVVWATLPSPEALASACRPAEDFIGHMRGVSVDDPMLDPVRDEPWVMKSFGLGVDMTHRWTEEWEASYGQACAKLDDPTVSDKTPHLLKIECLEEAAAASHTATSSFRLMDAKGLRTFASGYTGNRGGVRDLQPCDNEVYVRRRPRLPTDAEERKRVLELRAQQQLAFTLMGAGQREASLAKMAELQEEMAALEQDALLAELLLEEAQLKGDVQLASGPELAELYDRALQLAESTGNDVAAAQALLFKLTAALAADEPWEPIHARAQAAAKRAGMPFEIEQGLLRFEAEKAEKSGDADARVQAAAKLLRRAEEYYCLRCPETAWQLQRYAEALSSAKRHEEALAALQRASSIHAAMVGDAHPAMANVLVRIGGQQWWLKRYDDSQATFDRIDAILSAAFPEGSATLGWALENRANTEFRRGRPLAAARSLRRAEEMLLRIRGETHAQTVYSANQLLWYDYMLRDPGLNASLERLSPENDDATSRMIRAALAARSGDEVGAGDAYTEAEAEAQALVQPMPFFEVWLNSWAAGIDQEFGRVHSARKHADLALASAVAFGDELPQWQQVEVGAVAGTLRHLDGDHAAARPLLESVLMRADALHPDAVMPWVPDARFALAEIVAAEDPARAAELAAQAIREFEPLGPGLVPAQARVQAWLDQHRGVPESSGPGTAPPR